MVFPDLFDLNEERFVRQEYNLLDLVNSILLPLEYY